MHGDKRIRGRSVDSAVVWNLHTGEREQILPWYESQVSAIAFTPDGLSLATTDLQGVKVWDVTPSANPTEAILADIRQMNVGPYDWPQWGGCALPGEHARRQEYPFHLESRRLRPQDRRVAEGRRKNIKWVAPLGTADLWQPGRRQRQGLRRHQQRRRLVETLPAERRSGRAALLRRARTGKFLWQHSSEKLPTGRVHDWPLQGICSSAARRGRPAVVRHQPRRSALPRHRRLSRRRERRSRPRRRQAARSRRRGRRRLGLRHDEGAGRLAAQHGSCSLTIAGDCLFVCTSNGVDVEHNYIPAPDAPSFS